MRATRLIVLLLLALVRLAAADTTTHALPQQDRQRQQWAGDAGAPFHVSGCAPAVPAASLTLAAFACQAYVRDTTTGELVYVAQSAAAVGPLNAGNGIYWVALHADKTTSVSNWTRQTGTHYLWRQSSTQPTAVTRQQIVTKVTVAGGAITAVEPLMPWRAPSAALLGAVYVAQYATGGDGSSANPWTGWDTTVAWVANTTYLFAAGVYSYATCPAWGLDNIRLMGMGPNVVLKHTGTGNAVCLDGGASGAGVHHIVFENFAIQGNANSTNGLYLRSVLRSTVRQVSVVGASTSGAGVHCEWCVLDKFEDVRVSVNDANVYSGGAGFFSKPDFGVRLTRRGSGENSTANTFVNFVAEGLTTGSGQGIRLLYADANHFVGGTSESNIAGIFCIGGASGSCLNNSVHGMFFESNSSAHLSLTDGEKFTLSQVQMSGLPSSGAIALNGNFAEVLIQGGQILGDISVGASGVNTVLEGVDFRGTISDSSLSTLRCAVRDGAGANDYPVCHLSRNTNGANGSHLILKGQSGTSGGATTRYGMNTFASAAVAYIDALASNGSTGIVLQLNPSNGGIAVGTSGATITSILEGSATGQDVASIADNDQASVSVTVTGAALKDYALCSASVDIGAVAITGKVTAANTATILLLNNSGGAVDPPSADYRCLVFHRP